MKKSSKSKNAPKVDPYLEGLMAKLLDRLVSVEKKLDTVVAQTSGKASANSGAPKAPQAPTPPRHERTLYEAICADCHKVCEVPFKPSEDRPVYCKECFAKRKAGGRQNDHNKTPFNLTPVALKPKPVGKLGIPSVPPPAAPEKPKKAKKSAPAKKSKKKKK